MALAFTFLSASAPAQRVVLASTLPSALPNSPGFLASQDIAPAPSSSLSGTVLDTDGAEIAGATVVLEDSGTHETRTCKSGSSGEFTFNALPAGHYTVSIVAEGFARWTGPDIVTHPGESEQMPQIALEIASINVSVDAVFSPHDLAEEEIKVEEKQRVLGLVPNFYVVYDWHAPPLSPGQKFRLAFRAEIDPFTFVGTGVIAGIEQATNTFPGYRQGASGFARRYGASYADGFTGTLIGGAILPSLLHQDPRYFYKGSGTITSRVLYAIATVVICKGDNGKWQPNYSSVLGNLAAAGISNAYYPASDRHGAGVVVDNALIGTASGAVGSLMQEFFLRRIMLGSAPPPHSAP
jgi:hypothetical protein